MNILGFAGSTSSTSINKQLVDFTLTLFSDEHQVNSFELIEYEVPIYSVDREKNEGIPQKILNLAERISNADLLVLSLAEHNGTYTAAFKNTFDWLSRIPNVKVFNDKKIFLMATSPGGRGGAGVLDAAKDRFPRHGAKLVDIFSLPTFGENFNSAEGKLINPEKLAELKEKIESIKL